MFSFYYLLWSANNVGKGIIFLIGQDYYSYNYKDLKYASSNENLQEIYGGIKSINGTGLFVIGGFDQVASLLSHSDLNLAHLVDVNLTAVEYARLRLALTQICDTRFEYVSRLISRRVTGDFEDILSLKRYIDSKESAKRMLEIILERALYFTDVFCNDEQTKRLLHSSIRAETIEERLDYLAKFNLEFERAVTDGGDLECRKDEFMEYLLLYEQHLKEKEKCFDRELAEETATLLKSNFGISEMLLNKTILSPMFKYLVSKGDDHDSLADRRLWSFLELNKDNWLSSDLYFEKVKTMYQNGRIKFSHLDLANSTFSLNVFGDVSLIYLSNIHEWLKVELNHLISNLRLNGLKTDENAIIISTSTKEEGRGKITTRNL